MTWDKLENFFICGCGGFRALIGKQKGLIQGCKEEGKRETYAFSGCLKITIRTEKKKR